LTLRTLVAHPLERSCPDHVRPAQLGGQGRAVGLFYCTPLSLEIQVVVERHLSQLEFGMALCNASGAEFASSVSRDVVAPPAVEPGKYVLEIALPTLKLGTQSYYLDLGLRSDRGVEDHIVQAIHFDAQRRIRRDPDPPPQGTRGTGTLFLNEKAAAAARAALGHGRGTEIAPTNEARPGGGPGPPESRPRIH